MAAMIPPLDLPHDPIYDEPDQSSDPLTTLVMRGSHMALQLAEEEFGRSVVFCPRITELDRPHARARTMARVTYPQWPGYAFVHTNHATPSLLAHLESRYHIHHLFPDRQTLIPVTQLQPSRHLERMTAGRSRADTTPAPPAVGDLVSVQAGLWRAFQGEVTEVRRGMIVVAVPHSILTVRADVTAVTIIDRKKPLAQ